MGNVISSFFSGFTKVIGDLIGSPLDFLVGKSCSSVCGTTWDFICYIENFCVANLLKMAMVLVLLYIVLLFFYLLYKLGICHCVGHGLCKVIWACLVCWFSCWEHCCIFLWDKLTMIGRINRTRRRKGHFGDSDTSEEEDYDLEPGTSLRVVSRSPPHPRKWGDYRRSQLIRKSLRPRSHRIRVGYSTYSGVRAQHRIKHGRHVHHVRVMTHHTSKFARKGTKHRANIVHSRLMV